MIVLTRLNGVAFGINDEQIERLEDGPNTVVVLVNGNRYTALESLDEIVDAIVDFRARVLDTAALGESPAGARRASSIALFRPHSILSDEPAVTEITDDSPIPGKPSRRASKFRPEKRKGD